MITKIHVKRCIALGLMIALMLCTILAGLIGLGKKADAAIENLSFRNYCDFTSSVNGAVGTIRDCNGEILWDEDTVGGAEIYNLVGELKSVVAQNTIAYRNKQYITSAESYSLLKGVESLENSALDVNTTLDHALQKSVYEYMEAYGVKNGSALFIDANTGAIRCAVSLPAADPKVAVSELEDGALINKNLVTTIPGSTMKVVTGLLLVELYPEILEHYVECNGSYMITENQASVTCITQRGLHNLTSALGVSCNCYYADVILNILNENKEVARERMEELGIGSQSVKKELQSGKLTYDGSMTAYAGDNSFESVWSMIGEGKVQMSPLDMCRIVSGIVNEGVGKMPYLIENVTDAEGRTIEDFHGVNSQITDSETAQNFYSIWKTAYDTYYGNAFHPEITVAKTGTAEYANKGTSSTLVGYLKEQGLVFFVEVGDYEESCLMPVQVVNYVCELR